MTKRIKIYLAAPYACNRERHFREINEMAAALLNRDYIVFSPITHNHPIAMQERLPTDWNFWKKQDLPFLEWCDELYVYTLTGWESSVGVKAEMDYAKVLGKPIYFIVPSLEAGFVITRVG